MISFIMIEHGQSLLTFPFSYFFIKQCFQTLFSILYLTNGKAEIFSMEVMKG